MTDTQKIISTLEMPEKVALFKELYDELAGCGTNGDTELAHVNTFEASLLKSIGGSGTINEVTGLPQFGKGGGSPPPAQPTTTTQTSEFPTELRPFIKDILGEAKGEFAREKGEGYIPFGGPQLAQFTPEQQQAFATGREQFGARGLAGTPLGQASTYYQPALAATALGTSEIGAGDIGRRMDPFLQNVVDVAKREARRDEDLASQGRSAQAVGAGSFGGSRQAILEAEAERNLGQRLGDIQAQGLSQAFQNAQQAAEAQRAREMAGGRQFAGLGESAFSRARGDITGLAGVGEAQQGRSQQALDLARREFEEEKAFPSTALQRYSSLIRGWGLTPSQTTVTTPPAIPRPGLGQQIAGAAGTGIGLYGQFGGFDKRAGGLVGLMGGGTPMDPLRPPYELFPAPTNGQYNTGGMVGLNQGGTVNRFMGQLIKKNSVAHPIPNQPIPSGGGKAGGKGLFNNLIMGMLKKHYDQGTLPGQGQSGDLGRPPEGYTPFNVNLGRFADTGSSYHPGAATGGLLGLTVSQNAKRGALTQPSTDVAKLSLSDIGDWYRNPLNRYDMTLGEAVGRMGDFYRKPLTESDTTSLVESDDLIPEMILQDFPELLKKIPEGARIVAEKAAEFFPLDAAAQAYANLQAGQAGHGGRSDTGVPTGEVHDAEYTVFDRDPAPFGLDPSTPITAGTRIDNITDTGGLVSGVPQDEQRLAQQQAEGIAADNRAKNIDQEGDPSIPVDPMQALLDQRNADTSSAITDAAAAEQKYLDYLKGQSGGDQDKWGALTQLGLNLMSETPQYEGEGLLAIAGRAGKEPLAALQASQKEDKALNYKIAEVEKDMAVRRAGLKSASAQQSFDNRIKLIDSLSKSKQYKFNLLEKMADLSPANVRTTGSVIRRYMGTLLGQPDTAIQALHNAGVRGVDSEGQLKRFAKTFGEKVSPGGSGKDVENDFVHTIALMAREKQFSEGISFEEAIQASMLKLLGETPIYVEDGNFIMGHDSYLTTPPPSEE